VAYKFNSVFSELCVDYGPGNDTVVLRFPIKPGMTMLQSVKISPIKSGMMMFEYVYCKSVNRYIITLFKCWQNI
jgi:hypothetical protein